MSAYQQFVLSQPGVVGHWIGGTSTTVPFGAGVTPVIADASGNGKHLYPYGQWNPAPSIMPGEPLACAVQNATYVGSNDSVLGIAHSSDFNVPAWTLILWVQTIDLNHNPMLMAKDAKFAMQAQIPLGQGTESLFSHVATSNVGQTLEADSAHELWRPAYTYMLVASFTTGGGGAVSTSMWVNAVPQQTTSQIGWSTASNANNFAIAGTSTGGNALTGFWQHGTFMSTPLTSQATIRTMFALGMAPGLAQQWAIYPLGAQPPTGIMRGAVFSWSEPLVPANPNRKRLVLTNVDDALVWVRLAGTGAAVHTGTLLYPGEHIEIQKGYMGPVSAIHNLSMGVKTLAVEEAT